MSRFFFGGGGEREGGDNLSDSNLCVCVWGGLQ